MRTKHMGMAVLVALGVLLLWQGPAIAADQVNVNTATVEQLQTVKYIGATTAAAIVAYRTAHGMFKSLDGLTAVKGIGAKTLDKIREHLTVGMANPCNPCAGKM